MVKTCSKTAAHVQAAAAADDANPAADVDLLYPPYSKFTREMWNSADKLRMFMHPACLTPWPHTVVKKAMKTIKNKKVKTMKRNGKVIKAMKTIKSKNVKAMKAMKKR